MPRRPHWIVRLVTVITMRVFSWFSSTSFILYIVCFSLHMSFQVSRPISRFQSGIFFLSLQLSPFLLADLLPASHAYTNPPLSRYSIHTINPSHYRPRLLPVTVLSISLAVGFSLLPIESPPEEEQWRIEKPVRPSLELNVRLSVPA